ncbi:MULTISPECIES: chromate transporter [Paenibacillus]|uniref:Chromate transporter n=1 Tax=Paenibacillus naphthalenovorans TaxID=162209 RepID=A0A0U2KXX5_9BACL|nr:MULTISPECIES: chromate transporter [Paenibacillus]ALS21730.1 chromate transporter [Paenibacillus naphthalenovorans]NTZ16475.1 chromate transporter [Paenibacillus sp. JMULE4]GCL71458.1 chromate transporter [Paenibacillus naphthalenovorans]SDI89990.1 chromate transporter [Paenibacillus naphthalenovorans]
MLWSLFYVFLQIGFVSFGGGYAMIPVIRHQVLQYGWISEKEFSELVALAGMSPGPIATNSATLIGYKTAGLAGAAVSTLGMILPSLLLIILISAFFYKVQKADWVKATFYGLKPVVTGMIIYAAIHFGIPNGGSGLLSWQTAGTLIIMALCIIALLKYRMHPFAVIVLSGLLGIAFF